MAKVKEFGVCLQNDGFSASLEVRKLYPVIPDRDAEAHNLIRVVDESGADYHYPITLFGRLELPNDIQHALNLASLGGTQPDLRKIPRRRSA